MTDRSCGSRAPQAELAAVTFELARQLLEDLLHGHACRRRDPPAAHDIPGLKRRQRKRLVGRPVSNLMKAWKNRRPLADLTS